MLNRFFCPARTKTTNTYKHALARPICHNKNRLKLDLATDQMSHRDRLRATWRNRTPLTQFLSLLSLLSLSSFLLLILLLLLLILVMTTTSKASYFCGTSVEKFNQQNFNALSFGTPCFAYRQQ